MKCHYCDTEEMPRSYYVHLKEDETLAYDTYEEALGWAKIWARLSPGTTVSISNSDDPYRIIATVQYDNQSGRTRLEEL